ncbi:wd40 repeat-like-containing domain-containing [Trichoderma cornu-damae]|uniref:Wd40 repeat-like-containing domain-containing n=1 Tax=Trichoderma cornu-damae TaxID=654480 RepID=A0A9P8QJA8_9HYPO|nr:wd40 repeat-like-containing domain-containing [Trichoderma cornu-damae]
MEEPTPVASLRSLTLDLPPSCAEFCPAHPEYLVVGTYNLQKDDTAEAAWEAREEDDPPVAPKPQNRNGSLVVLKVEGDDISIMQTVVQPSALLDLRFYRDVPGYQNVLAVVSSTGTLAVFKLDPLRDASAPLQHLATSRCEDLDDDILFLQCNWHPVASRVLGVTTSTGLARLLLLDDEWRIAKSAEVDIENSLEAWCIAFSPVDPTSHAANQPISVYCGGDDSALRYTTCHWEGDGKENDPSSTPYMPFGSMAIKGQHDAGVTAILPLPLSTQYQGRLVVTGSYDDHLRVFAIHDLHQSHGLKRVQLLADANLGGGVWRLKLADIQAAGGSTRIRILASCMYAGAKLVEVVTDNSGRDWTCVVLARFEEHKSMNYASDMSPSSPAAGGRTRIVSTSFYDRLLCLWEYEPRR